MDERIIASGLLKQINALLESVIRDQKYLRANQYEVNDESLIKYIKTYQYIKNKIIELKGTYNFLIPEITLDSSKHYPYGYQDKQEMLNELEIGLKQVSGILETKIASFEDEIKSKDKEIRELRERLKSEKPYIPIEVTNMSPPAIKKIIEHLEIAYNTGTPELIAPQIRKLIALSIELWCKMNRKDRFIKNEQNELYDLPKIINISSGKDVDAIKPKTARDLSKIKFIGDKSLHSTAVILQEDVDNAQDKVRFFLNELWEPKGKTK